MKSKETPTIKDSWLFLFLYPIIAISIVHIGNDNSLRQLLNIPSYYSDLAFALISTYLVGWYLKKLHKSRNPKASILSLLLPGLLLPSLVIIGAEAVYLYFIDIDWSESTIFYLELPLVLLFLALINQIYIVLHHRQHSQSLEATLSQQKAEGARYYVAKLGTKNHHIPGAEVAYFYSENKLTFLVRTDKKKYLYEGSLSELATTLPPKDFFQLNRQVIACRPSIESYHQTETRRVKILLTPSLEKDIYISKTKAAQFFSWMKQ